MLLFVGDISLKIRQFF